MASMFDAVARRYDITSTVPSCRSGTGAAQRAAARALNIGAGDKARDLAAGTAVLDTSSSPSPGAWRNGPVTSRSACSRPVGVVPRAEGGRRRHEAAVRRRHDLTPSRSSFGLGNDRRHRRRAARMRAGDAGRRPAGGVPRVLHADGAGVPRPCTKEYLMRGPAGDWPARSPTDPSPTSIRPSRSSACRTQAALARMIGETGWSPGAVCAT